MALLRLLKENTPPHCDLMEPSLPMIELSLYTIMSDYEDREYFNCMMREDPHRGKSGQLTLASLESTIGGEDVDSFKLPTNCLMECSKGPSTPAQQADYLTFTFNI
ncbi:unnamed protein product [Prunus brigantina]